ncbi:adenylyltransferase [Leptospira perolatii]|uniref:Adenylyltransferase n=1 Tax=Leptospira perolatii TaxID=2023191 RepID=A0A2M9ZS64_9LEPT|nr:HesA/MoeB/ThiF family protein [Leptospira perolatii]PJZ71386.1 adenylyltransferase [Leptospira perolatii]PJZ74920.1 adenylyltransferase [Leptospira perolatii]
MLSPEELSRYSRNILLDEVKRAGQERLKASKVTIVGAGGLGSPALLYLAASGVGTLRIIDSDILDTTNLQRQVIYKHADIGKPKALVAAERARELNPFIIVEGIQSRLDLDNAEKILSGSDLVLEGSDNFETKFLVNDICVKLKIPFITAGILRFDGTVMGVRPGMDACFRCIYESLPPPDSIPSCSEAGVIGSMAGIVGTIQSTEAVKFLLGMTETGDNALFGKMLQVESKSEDFRKVSLLRRKDCPVCSVLG